MAEKQSLFQVKFTIKRPKYKSFIVNGYVLSTSRIEAIALATKTLKDTLKETKENDSEVKLLAACSLQTNFFLIAETEESKNK